MSVIQGNEGSSEIDVDDVSSRSTYSRKNETTKAIPFKIRTRANYTHDVINENNIKRITCYRKSSTKFKIVLVLNILSFGILHIISKFCPSLYIKLYCNNVESPNNSDFFLVEDIYGSLTLCETKINEYKSYKTIPDDGDNSNKLKIVHFVYNHIKYEYDVMEHIITPVYFNLEGIPHKEILNTLCEGLNTAKKIKIQQNRFGLNEIKMNMNLRMRYFYSINVPHLILVVFSSIIWFIGGHLEFGIILLTLVIGIFALKLSYKYVTLYGKLRQNEQHYRNSSKESFKVIRKIIDNYRYNSDVVGYDRIKIDQIIPGDVLLFNISDKVPCDCLLITGEALVSECYITGKSKMKQKSPLPKDDKAFNYTNNENSIILEGSYIVKTYSKLEEGNICALAINTGTNSFNGSQILSLGFIKAKDNNFTNVYSFFNNRISQIVLLNVITLYAVILVIILARYYTSKDFYSNSPNIIVKYAFNLLSIMLLPMFQLCNISILLANLYKLQQDNIICVDESRVVDAGRVNTIFLDKTGTLSEKYMGISGFHVAYSEEDDESDNYDNEKKNYIYIKTYNKDNVKAISAEHLNYYKSYVKYKISKTQLPRKCSKLTKSIKRESVTFCNKMEDITNDNFLSAMFIQCVITCNKLKKINNEIAGNIVEQEIFKSLKWDIDFSKRYNEFTDRVEELVSVYPKNYYKITEGIKFFNNYAITLKSEYKRLFNGNSKENINSFRLVIYKQFMNDSTAAVNRPFNVSSIVYNTLDNSFWFMTRGTPDKILKHCKPDTVPKNIKNTLLTLTKQGNIIFVYAFKPLDFMIFDPKLSEDSYMNNLYFCGFISLKAELRKETREVISKLKKMNCKLIINTGDGALNSIAVAYDSQMISDKNIYIFDLDKNKNIICKILAKQKAENKNEGEISPISLIPSISNISLLKNNTNDLNNVSFNLATKEKLLRTQSSIYNKGKLDSDENKNSTNFLPNIFNSIKVTSKKNLDSPISNISGISKSPATINIAHKLTNVDKDKPLILNKDLLEGIIENDNKKCVFCCSGDLFDYISNQNNDKDCNNNSKYPFSERNKEKYNIKRSHSNKNVRKINKNKEIPEYDINKKLLQYLKHCCRIYYNMTSIQKRNVIDYYRQFKDKIVCMVGDGDNDIDAIMSAHLGVSLSIPKRADELLCHYFTYDGSLKALIKILQNGRAFYENSLMLLISTILTSSLEGLVTVYSFLINVELGNNKLLVFNIIVFLFMFSSFSIGYDPSIDSCPFVEKSAYTSYNVLKIVGTIIIKGGIQVFYWFFYHYNPQIELTKAKKVFISYMFNLSLYQAVSSIVSFNTENYYRYDITKNKLLLILIIIFCSFYVINLFVSSRSVRSSIFSLMDFEYSDINIDTYDDRHKLVLFCCLIVDSLISIAYTYSIRALYKKLALKMKDKGKKEN